MSRKFYWLGLVVIAVVVLLTFAPALKLNFYADDYSFVEIAGRSSLPQYLAIYFDPQVQTGWYRPLQGMLFGVEYVLFGGNPAGYHAVNLLVHLLNCLLLFAIAWRVTQRWRVAFVAALIYAGLPLFGVAVFWPGDADFELTFFYLSSIFFWVLHLLENKRAFYIATFASFLLALFTKEFGVTLPVILFLVDRLLLRQPVSLSALVRRYALFGVAWIFYLPLEFYIQSRSVLTQLYGYGLGEHSFVNFFQYLAWLAFPWGLPEPLNFVWLIVASILAAYVFIAKKGAWLLFLAIAAVLAFLPVVNFPWFFTRYLYLSVMASALVLAIFIDWLWARWTRFTWLSRALSVAIALIVLANSFGSANATADFAEIGRQTRVAFRDISQRHATFPDDTLLYFIDPPQPTSQYSGMFFVRYGPGIHVTSTEVRQQRADLRSHQNAYVIYFDEKKRTREIPVDQSAVTSSSPIDFDATIRLEGLELPSANVKRGDAIVLLLYWRALKKIDIDYIVSVNLMDDLHSVIATYAKPPRRAAPMSTWTTGELIVDAVQIPISEQAPLGKFRLEIGMYDPSTMRRLMDDGNQGGIVIEPVSIVP